MDWLDLLTVQGILKSLLQHYSSKASVLQCSVRVSHPYRTTRKTTSLTRWTFVGKVMSLLFNMLSRLVIAFPPGSSEFSEFTQSCPTPCDPMDCSLPGSSIYGIFQARILEWVAISFSRRYSWPGDWTQVSRIVSGRFTVWATRERPSKEQVSFNCMAAVTICSDFGAQKNKVCHFSTVSPSTCHEVMGPDAMILVFWMWALSQLFHSPLSLWSRGSLVLLHFLP